MRIKNLIKVYRNNLKILELQDEIKGVLIRLFRHWTSTYIYNRVSEIISKWDYKEDLEAILSALEYVKVTKRMN